MSVWDIIKQAIRDIEIANNIQFGDQSWQRIKQMEQEIIQHQLEAEWEIKRSYDADLPDFPMRPKRNPYDF